MPPRLYLVTDRHATGGRTLAAVVADALRGADRAGDVAVQLREKDLEGRALLDLARALRASTAAAGARLYVNDRVDVALACDADGVHLGGGSLSPEEARAVAPDLSIAISAHSPAGVAAAARSPARIEFAVLGPIFDTPSKRDLGAPIGLAALGDASLGALPVLAIGGVNLHNALPCVRAGACGLACIRAVMAAPDPAEVVRAFLRYFR